MGISSVRGLVARAAFAPVLVFAIIACEDASSPPDGLGPSYSNTIVDVIVLPVIGMEFNTCTQELVDFSGTISRFILAVTPGGTPGASERQWDRDTFRNVTGVSTNHTYRVIGVTVTNVLFSQTYADVHRVRLQVVSTDGGGVFFADALVQIVFSGTGVPTGVLEVGTIEECRGGRN